MTPSEEIKLVKVYNDYFRVKYENSKWESLGRLLEYNITGNKVSLNCKHGNLYLYVISDTVIRIQSEIEGKVTLPSFALSETVMAPAELTYIENEFFIKLKTKKIVIEIIKDPIRIVIKNEFGEILNSDFEKGIFFNKEFVKCEKELPQNEMFYGFGEKTGPFQKRGTKMFMWNTDYPNLDSKSDPAYKSIPFFIGLNNGKAYGIFYDTPSWSCFDMGASDKKKYTFGSFGLNMDYYFIYGPEMKSVVSQYTELTGRIELPPLWSIGYQQCRWSYYPQDRVKELANTFRAKKIPCDAIYLDIDYMDEFKVFTHDKTKFPDFIGMTSYLQQKGFKLVCIIDPGVKAEEGYDVYDEGLKNDYFVKKPTGKIFYADVWPGKSAFPDFLNSAVQSWWASLQKRMIDLGVSGIWNDMNEPATFNTPGKTASIDAVHDMDGKKIDHALVHNLYGMLENKATYEGLKSAKPDDRPFILSRSMYAGGQKYAAVWMGDNTSNEEHLKLSIPTCLNLGLSGFSFSGMDIGGFHGNPSPELYTRWLQFGALFPLCRTHSVTGSNDQEPWSYGGGYEEINRKSIELRYKLLPYIYTLFHEATVSGIPVIRPLVLEFQEDQKVFEIEDEFMLGKNILVAPILELGKKSRMVYLPSGNWFDFYTNEKFAGQAEYEVIAEIEKLPIFIREGSIIPEYKVMQHTNEQPIDKVTFNIYPGESSDEYIYEDDGSTFAYKNGWYRKTYISQINKEGKLFINISKPEGNYKTVRTFQIIVKCMQTPVTSVKLGFDEIKITESEDEYYRTLKIAYYDITKNQLKIKFNDNSEDVMITILV